MYEPPATPEPRAAAVVYRHALPVRIWHWINAFCVILLVMSGLMIFNTAPYLAWGEEGHLQMPSWLSVQTSALDTSEPQSTLHVGSWQFDTSGLLGVPHQTRWGFLPFAVPPWLTFPPSFDLGLARAWHFLFAWIFVINLAVYGSFGLFNGHFHRNFVPRREQLRPRSVLADIWKHVRLHRARGEEARHYNLLQRLSYLAIVFVFIPTQVLSGLTMANGVTAAFPWLFSLFGGRQSARSIHFLCAALLLLFLFIHVFQVFVAGARNEIRSMITGRFHIEKDGIR